MTIRDYDKNIKELEERLQEVEGRESMVIRNCIITMKMKRKGLKKAERRAKREESNDG